MIDNMHNEWRRKGSSRTPPSYSNPIHTTFTISLDHSFDHFAAAAAFLGCDLIRLTDGSNTESQIDYESVEMLLDVLLGASIVKMFQMNYEMADRLLCLALEVEPRFAPAHFCRAV